jgi:type 1 glutamine amidotransferase
MTNRRRPARRLGTVVALVTCFVYAGVALGAEVVTYPAPEGEPLSKDYEVWADGQKVDVYTARVLDPPFAGKQWDFGGPYCFANFDMSGQVAVRITSPRSMRNVVIRPEMPGVSAKLTEDHTVILTLDGPRKLSVEPDGKRGPLLLFANPIDQTAAKPDDPGVIYFGPGIHRPGLVTVRDNQTLYLAGGAVVKGAIAARGEGIRICGRGILDGADYRWREGPHPFTLGIYGSHIELSGITVRGSPHWTIVPRGSRHVTIRNVKLCNSRVQNDDGINPCNSQDVLITDCFIRSDDDCVALKGLDFKAENSNVERIVVDNCTFWCDRARVFLLGHESRAEFMRNVTLRNLDILHFSMTPLLLEPGEDMRLEDIRVEDVRLHGEGQGELIRLRPVVNQYMWKKVPGLIRNVHFKNLKVSGNAGAYQVQLAGADAEHDVRNVTFEDVSILGAPLTRNSPQLRLGQHVEAVRFSSSPPRQTAKPKAPQSPVSDQERLKIEQAIPPKAPATPGKARKLLIFDRNVGYGGHRSAAHANLAFTLMGRKTGAFEAVVRQDPAAFAAENLKQFDAVFFNNTVGNLFEDPVLRQNLLEFVHGGGGLMGVHGATVAFTNWPGAQEDWPEFGEMLGARGASHRDSDELVFIKLDDPDHPLNQVFGGQGFWYRDEFFRVSDPYSRERVRVLLSIDTRKTDMNQGQAHGQCERADNDYALAWVRSYGKGRVFYCTIGHNPYVFWDPKMLGFYLAAAQFVLGDLFAPTTPSATLTPTAEVRQ